MCASKMKKIRNILSRNKLALLLAALTATAAAQWLNYPAPGIPRLPDGKPSFGACFAHCGWQAGSLWYLGVRRLDAKRIWRFESNFQDQAGRPLIATSRLSLVCSTLRPSPRCGHSKSLRFGEQWCFFTNTSLLIAKS